MGTDTYIKKDPQKIYRQENLIMLCDSDWVVIGIIDKGMTIGEEGIIGNDISQLLSEESLQKSILFKEGLEEKKIVLGFEMSVDTDKGKYLLTFSGIKIDNSYLVIASNSNNLLSELFDEMSRISNEQINMIREMAQEKVKVAKIARERIERDLHDSVSQTIFSTRIIAEILPELWKRDKVEAKKQLQKIKILAEDSLTEMRRI